jgi:AcrR family transcriptional regulator
MQDIADASGMTKAALYYHFRDKNELFMTMALGEMERFYHGLEQCCVIDRTLRENLINAGTFLFKTVEGDLPRLLLDSMMHLTEDEQCQLASSKPQFDSGPLAELFMEAARRGEIVSHVSPSILASLWFGMAFHQVQELRLLGTLPQPPEILATTIADVMLEGVRARS